MNAFRTFTLPMVLVAGLTAALAASSPAVAQVGALSTETVSQLMERVDSLKARVATSGQLVEESRPLVLEKEKAITEAPQIADKMIADLEAYVDQLKTGSEIYESIQRSGLEIQTYIDKFREGTDVQKQAAEALRVSLESIRESDARRDELVGKALAEIRKLKASKDDIVALMVVKDAQALASLYKTMIDDFETTVDEVSSFNKDLAKAAGVPTE
ncbi:MAG: hypothetical protein VYD87_17695 [Pseudomonadota bacterium]|nr:hypothetical protein [Pseudomonadota bacterium]